MNDRKPNLLDKFDISQLIKTAKTALEKWTTFGLKEKYNIKDIRLGDNDIVIYYMPNAENIHAIYLDVCQILAFITSFMGDELKRLNKYTAGVQAVTVGDVLVIIFILFRQLMLQRKSAKETSYIG